VKTDSYSSRGIGIRNTMDIAKEIIRNWTSDALDLSNLGLTELPTLPEGLRILYCSNNRLDKLPDTLPNSIRLINCSYNQLTTLPETLPASLVYLSCSYNRLTHLPDTLPKGLLELYCNNNQITKMPELPPDLLELVCAYNPMTTFPRILDYAERCMRVRNRSQTPVAS